MLVVKRSHPDLLRHHQTLLHRITLRIRQSLELQEILETTVAEVRSFLETDRVKVYRFHEDGSGEVMAEAIQGDRLPSLLGLSFPANDIPQDARELFTKARQRVAVDVVAQTTTGLSLLSFPGRNPALSSGDIRYRPVERCHVNYLTAMGVKSSVVVPILHAGNLWGLIISHHTEQRIVTEEELEFIGAVADQVEVAINQSMLLNQVRIQAEQEAKINQFTFRLHQGATIQLQAALEEAVKLFQASGGRLYLMPGAKQQVEELLVWGTQPVRPVGDQCQELEQHPAWQHYLEKQSIASLENEPANPYCWAINDIYEEPLFHSVIPWFQFSTIRGVLITPLQYKEQILGWLTLFRHEIETEQLWAGPCQQGVRQPTPRLSFEPWRERKTGQTRAWTDVEKKLAQAIGGHLSTAVQQYRLYTEVHSLNSNLEHQVQERTAELQNLLEQQQALSNGIAKIRTSLKLDVILQTTAEEVYRLLHVDRVVIYQFNPDWSGSVIAEAVGSDWINLRQAQWTNTQIRAYVTKNDRCTASSFQTASIPEVDTYLQDTQGGDFSRGCQVKQVDDIYAMNFPTCYLKVLESLQCRAYIIIPIFQKSQLWGLLAVYQNAGPRLWNRSDVELGRQMAAQLEVAIKQAELFNQTRSQTYQLSQMLVDLKQAQSQLIQTEKMSSLGHLVAGVAHEINNPINFIHGNLKPATEYAYNLLELVALYQQYLPNPDVKLREKLAAVDLNFVLEDFPKLLSSMQVGTERIREIVQSLRIFSRLDEAEFKAVDLHTGIDSTLMLLKHRLKANQPNIQVVKEYGHLPFVECYPGQLNQVFMNLLTNAIDALEERDKERSHEEIVENPSTIKIHTQMLNEQWVSIRICDNGPGMNKRVHSHIFDPFFTTKPVGKGTGLGLSISYQIITERHAGNLTCRSLPYQGTEFVIEIPINHRDTYSPVHVD
ncbi:MULTISPECIES: GAF domain-containing protein [unclassified Leptolyngbya]|uniref:GAF domain-containing sensor histidine kinase n=1 Tax=unclassified Leptolyngbya TaxID=2650499 RepID=UPI001689C0E6|nr:MULTISPECIES: GAF domain-containing protein [unclassified Leptolyngbya]MBD1909061.1 GAF domain-containing protein [Leptolyngbya sp. FACHB-8]MBD2157443.1 GAF domain-containing protein [Leptolyngbya sp. FACHB-16]